MTPMGTQSSSHGGYTRVSAAHYSPRDFITIDWFADRQLARRHKRDHRARNQERGFCGLISNWFYNIQGWTILFLVGAATATTGAAIHQTATWLGGLKFGYCTGHGFWVSRALCCVGAPNTVCEAWSNWHEIILPHDARGVFWFDYFVYVAMGVVLALIASYICVVYAPLSLGSGLAGTKVVLGGFRINRFLSGGTMFIKSIGLVLAVASGLSLGMEGPMVHIACCWGALLVKFFAKYRTNEAMQREIFSASAAAGVTAAFGAPLGGVLFSLEAMSSYFPHKTMWRSFWCAITAAIFLKYLTPYKSSRLVQFQVFYRGESWLWYELVPFFALGCVGGLAGALFISMHRKLFQMRRRMAWFAENKLKEVALLAAITLLIAFSNVFSAESQSFLLEHLFSHCTELKMSLPDALTDALCSEQSNRVWKLMLLLAAAGIGRFILTIFTFGSQVPSGIFMPLLVVGACMGRLMGWAVQLWHASSGDSFPFDGCVGRTDCIYPSLYAVVGAAAFLGGTTRLTVSLAVIMFELTGGLDFIVPLMVAVVPSKWVGDAFGRDSVFDAIIDLQGFPHINPTMELGSSAIAQDLMTSRVVVLSNFNETLGGIERLLLEHKHRGFPIVNNRVDKRVVGFVTRARLEMALDANEDLSSLSKVAFDIDNAPGRVADYVDLSAQVDTHPIIVHPSMSADQVLDMFKALGVRCIFVCNVNGTLAGIIKKKDMLRFIRRRRRPSLG